MLRRRVLSSTLCDRTTRSTAERRKRKIDVDYGAFLWPIQRPYLNTAVGGANVQLRPDDGKAQNVYALSKRRGIVCLEMLRHHLVMT